MSIQELLRGAVDRLEGETVAQSRLRLALLSLSSAAEANPKLYQANEWRRALTDCAVLLGEKAEVQGGNATFQPTHQLKTGRQTHVKAWQFILGEPIPEWVKQNFSPVDATRNMLGHRKGYGVRIGEWIIRPRDQYCCVLSDREFLERFRPLPDSALASESATELTPKQP